MKFYANITKNQNIMTQKIDKLKKNRELVVYSVYVYSDPIFFKRRRKMHTN